MNFLKCIFLSLSMIMLSACTISSIDGEQNENKQSSVDGCDTIFKKSQHCKTEQDTQRITIKIE